MVHRFQTNPQFILIQIENDLTIKELTSKLNQDYIRVYSILRDLEKLKLITLIKEGKQIKINLTNKGNIIKSKLKEIEL